MIMISQKDFYNVNWEAYGKPGNEPILNFQRSQLFKRTNFAGKKVLDLGCGLAHSLKFIKNYELYVGVDCSDVMVKHLRESNTDSKNTFIVGDVRERLNFVEKFDVIIVCNVIHHVNFSVLKLFREYLNPNGILLLSEPILKNCKGKNIGFVYFNKPIPIKEKVKVIKATKYEREHPADFEFSVPEIQRAIKEAGFLIINESTMTLRTIPFTGVINQTLLLN